MGNPTYTMYASCLIVNSYPLVLESVEEWVVSENIVTHVAVPGRIKQCTVAYFDHITAFEVL